MNLSYDSFVINTEYYINRIALTYFPRYHLRLLPQLMESGVLPGPSRKEAVEKERECGNNEV